MWDFFKDFGGIILTLALGLIGFGKVWNENTNTKIRVKKLENQDSITLSHCREKQDSCHLVQKAYHGGVEKDIEELRVAFKTMKLCNDTQHSKLMDRIDKRHGEVVEHIINLNKINGG